MLITCTLKIVGTAAAVVAAAYLVKVYADKVCSVAGDAVDVASEQVVGG